MIQETIFSSYGGIDITGLFNRGDEKIIIKPVSPYNIEILPIAANEYISYRLLMLLKERGCSVRVAHVDIEMKRHGVAMIEYLGEHSRLPSSEERPFIYPDWLYYFNRWTGRLDSPANLLLLKDETVVPVDFAMSYSWACGAFKNVIRVDDFNVPYKEEVKQASSEKVREAIKSITDREVAGILWDEKLNGFYTNNARIAYYTGLIFRRDNL